MTKLRSLYKDIEKFSADELSKEQIVEKISIAHSVDKEIAETVSAAFIQAEEEANKIMLLPKCKKTKSSAKTKSDLRAIVRAFKVKLRRLCRDGEIDFAGLGRKVIWSSKKGKGLSKPFTFVSTDKLSNLISAQDFRASFNKAIDERPLAAENEKDIQITKRYHPELLHEKVQNLLQSLRPSMKMKFSRVDIMRKHGFLVSGLPKTYEQNKPVSAQKRSVLRKCLSPVIRSRIKIKEVGEESVEVSIENVLHVISKAVDSTTLMVSQNNRLTLLKKARKLKELHCAIKQAKEKYNSALDA